MKNVHRPLGYRRRYPAWLDITLTQPVGNRKLNYSSKYRITFGIRHAMLTTVAIAMILAFAWPYFDDSRFVTGCEKLDGKSLNSAIELAEQHRRTFVTNENSRGDLLGLNLYSTDGHMIALAVKPIGAIDRPTLGWEIDSIREMTIQSVNIYDLRAMEQHQESRGW